MSNFLLKANRQCAGGAQLQAGECPQFKCDDRSSSCNGKGECNEDKSACICDTLYGGNDCSIFLEGKKNNTGAILAISQDG